MSTLPIITATALGEFIRYNSCERRLRLWSEQNRMSESIPFWGRLQNSLDIVLQQSGKDKANSWKKSLDKARMLTFQTDGENHGEKTTTWNSFLSQLELLAGGTNAYAREVVIEGQIGGFHVAGQIDFLLVLWKEEGLVLQIVECKASRKEATYQKIQVGIYNILVRQLLNRTPGLAHIPVECVIARIDDHTNEIQDIFQLPALDLSRETMDIIRMLDAGGKVETILATDPDALPFQIESKCDSCVFSIHCLTESARQRRLEILSINPASVRALQQAGVQTIDDLARLDPAGPVALGLRNDPSFSAHIASLIAKARSRLENMPQDKTAYEDEPDAFEVNPLPVRIPSQLPEYDQDGNPLIRIYISVDMDYVEKRIVAVAAHVTKSEGKLTTRTYYSQDRKPVDDPLVIELIRDQEGNETEGPLQGEFVKGLITKQWTHKYDIDNAYEELMLNTFLEELYKAIRKVAAVGRDGLAPVHFYFWTRQELGNLIEACSRSTDSKLLWHLQQLMGCRQSLEQTIYSCLQDEVRHRYALGWTGTGLSVATSLKWFGKRFHWTRKADDGEIVELDRIFTQDIFDFKTDLWLTPRNTWTKNADKPDPGDRRYKFEIRSRFNDGLTPPYLYSLWDALPDQDTIRRQDMRMMQSYRNASDYIETYLEARLQALRWIEERVAFKNRELEKPLLSISTLRTFDLQVNSVARAAIDYLRLDYHVRFTDWLTSHFVPPAERVAEGKSIPLRNVNIAKGRVSATIDAERYGTTVEAILSKATSLESFVRLTPYSGDAEEGQTRGQLLYGKTCTIDTIHPDGSITLDLIPYFQDDRYVLKSISADETIEFATLDESISDFVAGRVDRRLNDVAAAPAYQWLTPVSTDILIPDALPVAGFEQVVSFIGGYRFLNGHPLATDQHDAILQSLQAKIHLLQGPPGTGKSTTTSVNVLTHILTGVSVGQIVIIAANTHLAVNSLLEKIDKEIPEFNRQAAAAGLPVRNIRLVKFHASTISEDQSVGGNVEDFSAEMKVGILNGLLADSVVVMGGTTGSVLKFIKTITKAKTYQTLSTPLMIIDEASMMVFPHLLALATFIHEDGKLLLAGDHRQLSPILAHDWKNEDRPPVMLYKPYVSAYQAIWDIRTQTGPDEMPETALSVSQLNQTFRLPYEVRGLISKLYELDNISLQGRQRIQHTFDWSDPSFSIWQKVWNTEEGLFLITHNERLSRKNNLLEVAVIEQLMTHSAHIRLDPKCTAIITPHRAQRALLKHRLSPWEELIDMIETVEKLQGSEKDNIIVSATASDPAAIGNYAEFILSLNRANVAFSRPKKRLFIVCSEELLNFIPTNSEDYQTAMLWKELRNYCNMKVGVTELDNHNISFFSCQQGI